MIILEGDYSKTGRYMKVNTHSYILVHLKGKYYTPLWYHNQVRTVMSKTIKKPKEKRTFFERIIRGIDEVNQNTKNIIVMNNDIFEFMRDLITLTVLGFPENIIIEVMKQPYTRTNYHIIKTSLKLITGKEDIKETIHYLINNKTNKDYLTELFNALTKYYTVLHFPNESVEYKFILKSTYHYHNTLVNLMKPSPAQPYCTPTKNNHLFNNVVHYCSIRPGEYSLHLYDGSKWVEVFNRIKCEKITKSALLEFINENNLEDVVQDKLFVDIPVSKKGLIEEGGSLTLYKTGVERSVNKVYYYKKWSNKVKVYCIPTKHVELKAPNVNEIRRYHLFVQDLIPYKVLIQKHATEM